MSCLSQLRPLSKREREVVELLLQGKSNKLIAASLDIAERTVEFHLKNVYAKFQVSSRVELILKLRDATVGVKPRTCGNPQLPARGKAPKIGARSIHHWIGPHLSETRPPGSARSWK